jgi:MoaA/NifB/PqqE/SkfB family radical SAM enzyme
MNYLTKIHYSRLLSQPINQIYKDLKAVHKDMFSADERILFVDDVENSNAKEHLNRYLSKLFVHLDIDTFFVEIINRGNLSVDNPTNYNIPDTICMTPWVGLEIDVDSSLHRCCLWDRQLGEDTTSIVEYFASDKQQELKQQLLLGNKPSTCSKCWQVEDNGGVSKRLNDEYVFREHKFDIDYNDLTANKILNLDIKLGNKCNLACRICSSRCSSTWGRYADAETVEFDWLANESSTFWSDIIGVSKDVRYITFAGGEPLLDKTHRKLLQYFIDTELSKQVTLHYNTNGTVFADFLFNYWDKFKQVELSFSIDAVGKRFMYERFGSTWRTVSANLRKYAETLYTCNIYATVTNINVMYANEVFELSERLGLPVSFSALSDPVELTVTNLPSIVKENVRTKLLSLSNQNFKDKIQPILDIMDSKQGISSVRDYLKPQDQKRATFFSDYYPELNSLLSKEN